MKVCIVGAGAIGVLFGARLGQAGHTVAAIARGATLTALRAHGSRLQAPDGLITAPVSATDDPAELEPQDLVVLALKYPALPALAASIAPLVGPSTMVLSAMNGVPWWFFDGLEGPLRGATLSSVDPAGDLRARIPTARVIGCVIHISCASAAPGLTRLGFGNGLIIGEPGGAPTPRLEALAGALREAGFDTSVSERIQRDIWYKLWGNMTMNPISALTGATCDRILDDALVRENCIAVMDEAAEIGRRIGCPIDQSAEDRIAVTRKLGAFKTSMLQDVEAGKPLEIDALVGVVHEIAGRVGVRAPHTAALLGLVRLFARVRGLG